MNATIPADLLNLKARLEQWRTTRKYIRQPIPEELRQAAREISDRYPRPLVRRIFKLDPQRLNGLAANAPARTAPPAKRPATFFQLPADALLSEPLSAALSAPTARVSP